MENLTFCAVIQVLLKDPSQLDFLDEFFCPEISRCVNDIELTTFNQSND